MRSIVETRTAYLKKTNSTKFTQYKMNIKYDLIKDSLRGFKTTLPEILERE